MDITVTAKLDLTELFCYVDNFYKEFEKVMQIQKQKTNNASITDGKKRRNRPGKLSLSEVATIVLGYHYSHFDCFKWYYLRLQKISAVDFGEMPSYPGFTALIKKVFPFILYLFETLKGQATGVQFIDSTTLEVSKMPRVSRHKVFRGLVDKVSKISVGWFFGFKLHTIINHNGEIVSLCITEVNFDDRNPVKLLSKNIFGKLYADKGYISTNLQQELLQTKDVLFVTRLKKNMKNILMPIKDKILLYKRSIIESIFGK